MATKKELYYNFEKKKFRAYVIMISIIVSFGLFISYGIGFDESYTSEKTTLIKVNHKYINKVFQGDSIENHYIISDGSKMLFIFTDSSKKDYDKIQLDSSYWIIVKNDYGQRQDIITKILTK